MCRGGKWKNPPQKECWRLLVCDNFRISQILKHNSDSFHATKLLNFPHIFLLQPHHGRQGDLEGGRDGRPLRENPKASRPCPWLPQLQEGPWIQGQS